MNDKTTCQTTSPHGATMTDLFWRLSDAIATLDPFQRQPIHPYAGDDAIVRAFIARGDASDDRVPWHRYAMGGV